MIDEGFCSLCGRRFDEDPHREHDEHNHTDCLEKFKGVIDAAWILGRVG